MSELKPIDIWEDATNAVCQIMQESKMCKCPDGECLASTIEPSKETLAHWNTSAAPDVPELVRYERTVAYEQQEHLGMVEHRYGEYVLHSEAAKIVAAKDAEIERLEGDFCRACNYAAEVKERAEVAEAKLAQIKAQEPVGYVVELWAKGNRNGTEYDFYVSRSRYQTRLSVAQSCVEHWKTQIYKDDRLSFKIIPLYATPASDSLKAKNERLKEALIVASKYRMTADDMDIVDAALKGVSNDKG